MKLTVYGLPAPKGSKSFKGMSKAGHAIMVESSKKVKPWAEAVKWAALEWGFLKGPVQIEMVFTLPKPKSAPKRWKTWPDRKPDIDKLCRSTLDALVAVGAIEDDARVIRLLALKVFPGEHADALDVPGAVITIAEVLT
jgi:Holliday junction resolvase RusA-like endonuclease